MFSVLRTVFCILAVLCVAASVPIGAIFDWVWFFACVGGALVFGLLMLLVKDGNPLRKKKKRKTDFMNSPEENSEILKENEEA